MRANSGISLQGAVQTRHFTFPKHFINDCRSDFEDDDIQLDKVRYDWRVDAFNELQQNIDFNDNVCDYLLANPSICEILNETKEVIEKYFSYACLSMEKDSEDFLWLYICTTDEPKVALKKLWSFDANWWLDYKNQHKLNIYVEVVPI